MDRDTSLRDALSSVAKDLDARMLLRRESEKAVIRVLGAAVAFCYCVGDSDPYTREIDEAVLELSSRLQYALGKPGSPEDNE